MLYTDPLSKVAVWLPVQLFWYSVSALFLSLHFIYLFIIIIIIFTVAWSITGGQKITPRVRQQNKNK